jgi:hypothetical protein
MNEEAHEYHNIAWEIMWAVFKNHIGFNCDNIRKKKHWTFLVKSLTRSLPVGSIVKQQRPELYETLGCATCGDTDTETWQHLLICPKYKE